MNGQAKHFYAFGPFRFDLEERVLLRDGSPVTLGPKVIETTLHCDGTAGVTAGVTDRLWDVNDLVALRESYEQRRAERAA